MTDRLFLTNTADDEVLNEILEGRSSADREWPSRYMKIRLSSDEVGILAIKPIERSNVRRPVALIVRDEITRRLFGRYSQLRSDLSPLSAWCHIIDWRNFERLENLVCAPDLGGFDASWIGLCVAEALLLSDRNISNLKLAACLATQSYTLARARALWPEESMDQILARYDICQRTLRTSETSGIRLRPAFEVIWASLIAVSSPMARDTLPEVRLLRSCLSALQKARLNDPTDEAQALYIAMLDIPQAEVLVRLDQLKPEARVNEFDRIIEAIESSEKGVTRTALLLLAGYISTVAAGGSPSLGLAEQVSPRWPQVMAWAYILGGIGEAITWTSSFDGLGRLVARELIRPMRLDEPPLCDFALSEALVLVDKGLRDPLVHLRVKQSRIASVALYPGVNIAVPIGEGLVDAKRETVATRVPAVKSDAIGALADAMWPHLEKRISSLISADAKYEYNRASTRNRGTKKQTRLPLDDS